MVKSYTLPSIVGNRKLKKYICMLSSNAEENKHQRKINS